MTSRPPANIGLLFDWHAERQRTTTIHLDRPFELALGGATSYGADELAALVAEIASALYAAGLRPGDRLAVIKENHLDMLLASAAAARIGAIAATISAANRPTHLEQILGKLRPDLTLAASEVVEGSKRQGVDLTSFAKTVTFGKELPSDGRGIIAYDELRGGGAPVTIRPDHEPMMITHTSGTTSCPKLVVHTAETNRAATRLELLRLPIIVSRPHDVCLSSILYAHSRAYAWITAQFKWAPRALLIASTHELGDVERLLEAHSPTTVEATPNVFQHWLPLVKQRPELFARVRYYMNTFDIMHPSIARPFMNASRRPIPMWGHSWGQSEVGPIAGSGYTRGKINRLAGTAKDNMNNMGWPWFGLIRAKVVDPDTGKRRPAGEPGIILVRSKSVCVDYLGESDRHRAKLVDGWWNTGDMGYKDRFGRIWFLDRAVDSLTKGSATELESVLLQRLAGAQEVVVLSRGELPPTPVISLDGCELDESQWLGATRDLPELAPPIVVPWHEIPRTATWKVRRKELRQMVLAEDRTALEERFT